MVARFFIHRPVMANVLALLTLLLGAVAWFQLPIAQYPDVVPPAVQVEIRYPGASATTLAETVAQPVEKAVNGTDGMLYMQSTSTNDGVYTLTITFAVGRDGDQAQVDVQNALSAVEAKLPQAAQQQGISVKQKSSAILEFVALTADDPQLDSLFLSNYARLYLQDELARVPGVADVSVFGAGEYAMRVWLDADKLRARGLSTSDVSDAVQAQSQTVGAGQLDAPPVASDSGQQIPITVEGRLDEVAAMAQLIVKANTETDAVTRLSDVARVELASQTYSQIFRLDGQPAAALAISQLPEANALDVATAVNARMSELAAAFPAGLAYSVPFDTTRFVDAAFHTVWKTLAEAFLIVVVVILLFLQNWRAVLVPVTTVPITLVGAMLFLALLGFSLNMSTLFALVLAIGIVVDDAIVIVEGTSRHLSRGHDGKSAAELAMSELSGPIVGITLVLMAVFLPASFLPGLTGEMYRQFALVIAATAIISGINALTLKPVQASLWMRPPRPVAERNGLFRGFEALFSRVRRGYRWLLIRSLRAHVMVVVASAAIAVLAVLGFKQVPSGFLPLEDQGYLIVSVELTPGASLGRTDAALEEVRQRIDDQPGVADVLTIAGVSVTDANASLPAAGLAYVVLKPWDERDREQGLISVYREMNRRLAHLSDGVALVLPPPSIQGIGNTGGLSARVSLEDGTSDYARLAGLTQSLVAHVRQADPALAGIQSTTPFASPTLQLDIDRTRVARAGVDPNAVFETISSYLGSNYVNQFSWFGQTFQVYQQADDGFRNRVADIGRLTVPNAAGDPVPLSTLVSVTESVAPPLVTRFNNRPAANLVGQAPSMSSGEIMTQVASAGSQTLPAASAGLDWEGVTYQESLAGSQIYWAFGLSLVLVYLLLAAQYESWFLPVAVVLSVPTAFAGTVATLLALGLQNTLYTQIGLILLVALAAKNAILVVEFAREITLAGGSPLFAAVRAASVRLRPILMTSLTFILGMVPLILVTGAGASASRSIGVAVVSGMLVSTAVMLLTVPATFVAMHRLERRWKGRGEVRADRRRHG